MSVARAADSSGVGTQTGRNLRGLHSDGEFPVANGVKGESEVVAVEGLEASFLPVP